MSTEPASIPWSPAPAWDLVTYSVRAEAERRANEAHHGRRRALFMFASDLGMETLKQFFLGLCPEVGIQKLVRVGRYHWIIVLATHEMAQTLLREGHGRFPFPSKGFPYVDPLMWAQYGPYQDQCRLDINWARKKPVNGTK